MKTEKKFEIKSYGKGELAGMYLPHITQDSASKTLKKWIDKYPGLNEALAATGLTVCDRRYTPAQIRLIVEALGEPLIN